MKMAKEDKEKILFYLRMGNICLQHYVLWLCNALTTFQKIVMQIFKEHFNDFMQVFLDDFNVYGNKETFESLKEMYDLV